MALYLGSKKMASGAITNNNVSGGSVDTTPIGVILEYPVATPPSGWLICDGSAVSRTTFSELFHIIGTTYGGGDGSTTFNLPNLKGKVPVGKDSSQEEFNSFGKIGGEKTHKLSSFELPNHKHEFKGGTNNNQWYSPMVDRGNNVTWGGSFSDSNEYKIALATDQRMIGDTDNPHNNLQPYIVVNYIIKVTKEVSSSSVNEIYNAMYPIGRGFIDFTDTDYSNWLGFTWERELVGLMPVGYKAGDSNFGTIGKTGGARTHRHDFKIGFYRYFGALVGDDFDNNSGAYSYSAGKYSKEFGISAQRYNTKRNNALDGGAYAYDENTITSTGDTDLGSSLPPHKVVAYWKRVA